MNEDNLPEEPAKKRGHQWRSSNRKNRLPEDKMKRQGEITMLAFQLLGGRDAAIDFLNGSNPILGGRPLDLAIESKDGFAAVELALRGLASTD